ncbi:MAG: radical SAM protein, partial [Elusimicrobia bacterium]|nr:radical SAM protein [Elusimicrobiota bacterium]
MSERVDLKVGFRCNNYCHFCVQGDKRERLPAKPEDELVKSLEEGRAGGAVGVVITGGEPTLHKQIVKIARTARDLGYTLIQVQSNGRTFCYEDFCKRLI